MRVLHLIDSLNAGGAERLVVDVINGLPQWHHHLIILNGPETLRPEVPASCHFLNLQRNSSREIWKHARTIKKYIRQHHIELVHAHLFFSSAISRLATPRNLPLFNSVHNPLSLDTYTKNKLSLYLEKITYRKHHHIVSVSKVALKDFDQWIGLKGPHTVLYNCVRDQFFAGKAKGKTSFDSIHLVAVGNLREQKNYSYLIEAFKHLRDKEIYLDIYGEGHLRSLLQQEIDQHNLKIVLKDQLNDVSGVLPGYDLYVMSSLFEGFGIAPVEAMASGLPLLLSDLEVLREVTHENALFFDPNNVQSFVKLINDVASGKHDLTTLSAHGIKIAKAHYQRNDYLGKLQQLYRQAVTGKKFRKQPAN